MSHEKDKAPDRAAIADWLKKHKLQHHAGEAALKLVLLLSGNAKYLKIGNSEQSRGLLEGSIIGSRLAYPDKDTGELVYEQAEAGRWLGYDFRRPKEFPSKRKQPPCKQLWRGKLFAVMLDEVKDHSPDHKTPTSLLSIGSIDHILRFTACSEDTLISNGMLETTTYRQAYENVGAYEQYAEDLDKRALTDYPINAVTPKGNTLLLLLKGGGKPDPGPDPAFEFDHELAQGIRIA